MWLDSGLTQGRQHHFSISILPWTVLAPFSGSSWWLLQALNSILLVLGWKLQFSGSLTSPLAPRKKKKKVQDSLWLDQLRPYAYSWTTVSREMWCTDWLGSQAEAPPRCPQGRKGRWGCCWRQGHVPPGQHESLCWPLPSVGKIGRGVQPFLELAGQQRLGSGTNRAWQKSQTDQMLPQFLLIQESPPPLRATFRTMLSGSLWRVIHSALFMTEKAAPWPWWRDKWPPQHRKPFFLVQDNSLLKPGSLPSSKGWSPTPLRWKSRVLHGRPAGTLRLCRPAPHRTHGPFADPASFFCLKKGVMTWGLGVSFC